MKQNRQRHSLKRTVTSLVLAVAVTAGSLGFNSKTAYLAEAAEPYKVDAASAVNYSSILGRAVDYGILAHDFEQCCHMETTLATFSFKNNGNNNDVDLTDTGTAQFIVGELADENSRIELGSPGPNTKTFNIEATAEIFEDFDPAATSDQGKVRRWNNFRDIATIYPKIEEKSVIEANIDKMTGNIIEKSRQLDSKANSSEYKVDLSEVGESRTPHYYIDLTDKKYENAVVYVNVDDDKNLGAAIAQTGCLHINKLSSTVVVMNMDSDNSTDWTTGDPCTILSQYNVKAVDGENGDEFDSTTTHSGNVSDHNKLVNKEMAQKIIWNVAKATDVTINTSAGTFLVPDPNAYVQVGSSAGWLATAGKAANTIGEWHYIYEGVSEDTNSDTEGQIHFAARKAFTSRYDGNQTAEDTTVLSKGGEYKFYFYETGADFSTENAKSIQKFDKNSNAVDIANEDTNKIKFPVLKFYKDAAAAASEEYVVASGSSKTFYYVIKEADPGKVVNGIKNSDGEIDITLKVTNKDGELTYKVSSVTYLGNKEVYKTNDDIDMSGIEFSLGAFFNLDLSTVEISKQDQFGREVEGATLTLTGRDIENKAISFTSDNISAGEGAQVRSDNGSELVWVSGKGSTSIRQLPDGEYTLKETNAPENHKYASDITFTIIDSEIVLISGGKAVNNKIIMVDEALIDNVKITKQDQFGKEVKGAQLQITAEDAEVTFTEEQIALGKGAKSVQTSGDKLIWVSGSEPTYIKGLLDGKYTLTENIEPNGYTKAESVEFVVENGKLVSVNGEAANDNTVVMVDKAPVTISKVAADGGSELPGAELQLSAVDGNGDKLYLSGHIVTDFSGTSGVTVTGWGWDSDGVYKWTSGNKPLDFKGLPDGTYTLEETGAPQGYKYAESMKFVIADGTVQSVNGEKPDSNIIVMQDEAEGSTSTETSTELTSETTTETVSETETHTRKSGESGEGDKDSTTSESTTSEPTTSEPTTSEPTTSEPTTSEPTTSESTTSEPTTSEHTTSQPTTSEPTTAQPTTSEPTTQTEAPTRSHGSDADVETTTSSTSGGSGDDTPSGSGIVVDDTTTEATTSSGSSSGGGSGSGSDKTTEETTTESTTSSRDNSTNSGDKNSDNNDSSDSTSRDNATESDRTSRTRRSGGSSSSLNKNQLANMGDENGSTSNEDENSRANGGSSSDFGDENNSEDTKENTDTTLPSNGFGGTDDTTGLLGGEEDKNSAANVAEEASVKENENGIADANNAPNASGQPAAAKNTNGGKLPQSGSAADTTTIFGLGMMLVLAGIEALKKRLVK